MLLFHTPHHDTNEEAVARRGLTADDERGLLLHSTLQAAERSGSGPILVVDPGELALSDRELATDESFRVSSLPPEALSNVNPYRPPTPVTAAGGYVGCALPEDIALLLIFRRGVWDLPKGVQDPGESIEACARREVREEVGIDTLEVLHSLGTTQHGYSREGAYIVKTTHWYLMQTSDRSFEPERREGIERIAWARWRVARRHIGYGTLARHMDRVETEVRATLTSGSSSR